jgi:hypothetical protein
MSYATLLVSSGKATQHEKKAVVNVRIPISLPTLGPEPIQPDRSYPKMED